eukprot:g57749.t1
MIFNGTEPGFNEIEIKLCVFLIVPLKFVVFLLHWVLDAARTHKLAQLARLFLPMERAVLSHCAHATSWLRYSSHIIWLVFDVALLKVHNLKERKVNNVLISNCVLTTKTRAPLSLP